MTYPWQDPSALWHSSTWSDLSENLFSSIYAFGYDSSSQQMFAGGQYSSTGYNGGGGGYPPFIVSYDQTTQLFIIL